MPVRLPSVPNAASYYQRLLTFGSSGNINCNEKLFAIYGFVKNGEIVECAHCGQCARVDLNLIWNTRDIIKLHSASCTFKPSEIDYIRGRAIFIRTRDVKGKEILSEDVLLIAAEMGFSNEIIINATVQFFHDYGRYPRINDMVDYILR